MPGRTRPRRLAPSPTPTSLSPTDPAACPDAQGGLARSLPREPTRRSEGVKLQPGSQQGKADAKRLLGLLLLLLLLSVVLLLLPPRTPPLPFPPSPAPAGTPGLGDRGTPSDILPPEASRRWRRVRERHPHHEPGGAQGETTPAAVSGGAHRPAPCGLGRPRSVARWPGLT